MAKSMPRAGRAPRTPGTARPPVQPGKTAGMGKMRDRMKIAVAGNQPPPTPEPRRHVGSPGS